MEQFEWQQQSPDIDDGTSREELTAIEDERSLEHSVVVSADYDQQVDKTLEDLSSFLDHDDEPVTDRPDIPMTENTDPRESTTSSQLPSSPPQHHLPRAPTEIQLIESKQQRYTIRLCFFSILFLFI